MWGFPCRLAQTHIPTKTYELCEDFLADLLTTTRAAKKFQAYIPTKNLWAMWRLRCRLADNSKSCKDISNLHTYKNLWAMWGFPCSDNATDQSYLGLFTLRVTPKVLKCIYVLHPCILLSCGCVPDKNGGGAEERPKGYPVLAMGAYPCIPLHGGIPLIFGRADTLSPSAAASWPSEWIDGLSERGSGNSPHHCSRGRSGHWPRPRSRTTSRSSLVIFFVTVFTKLTKIFS